MKKIIAILLTCVLALGMVACGSANPNTATGPNIPGTDNNILTVGMECAYAPYNWTQMDASNGAVPIVNTPGA